MEVVASSLELSPMAAAAVLPWPTGAPPAQARTGPTASVLPTVLRSPPGAGPEGPRGHLAMVAFALGMRQCAASTGAATSALAHNSQSGPGTNGTRFHARTASQCFQSTGSNWIELIKLDQQQSSNGADMRTFSGIFAKRRGLKLLERPGKIPLSIGYDIVQDRGGGGGGDRQPVAPAHIKELCGG